MPELLQWVHREKKYNLLELIWLSNNCFLKKVKENNVIEHKCPFEWISFQQPEAKDVVQGITRVLGAIASNYPGI